MAEQNYSPFSGFQKSAAGPGNFDKSASLGSKLQSVDWATAKLVPGQWKVFDAKAATEAAVAKKSADTAAKTAGLTAEEIVLWRKEHGIQIFAPDCPAPLPSFEMLTMLPPFIQKKFAAEGFKAPTPIQAQAWPILFAHRDIVGIAKTGSGKTLAFIIPAIAHISQQDPLRPGDGPICIVLAPTRELAMQIEVETRKVIPAYIRCACFYGGTPKGPQCAQLREGVHLLVGTPGRIIDMMEIRRLNLMRVTYLCLDEADRMLDMGFEPQVKSICSQVRPERQTIMFSATWPKEIQRLAAQFQRDFIRIHVGSSELSANSDVTQSFILCQEYEKFEELKKIMAQYKNKRILVFCKTKKTADQLEFQLKRTGFDAMAIHGDKEQRQREFILDRFRKDSRLCVVATDVAARGLDIKQLEVVVNYDFPMQIDDYVHRIGRTGRAGEKGFSFTMITKREAQVTGQTVRTLIDIVSKAKQVVPEWMQEWSSTFMVKRGREAFGRWNRNMPQVPQYQHGNRPSSFETSAVTAAPAAAAPKQFFGLAPTPVAVKPFTKNNANVTRFADDDDDAQATKKSRME